MAERLIIRLASNASQKNHWLIWSNSENEIIASGLLDNAAQLSLLTEKAQSRLVICLLPGVDVSIKNIEINGSFNRQMQLALPYMLEEELASDVDQLHFSVINKQNGSVHVAICEKQKMSNWLSWLAEAQISCKQFIPEYLALPEANENRWQALLLDDQWIIRENLYTGWCCEAQMLDLLLESKLADKKDVQIESFTAEPQIQITQWINKDTVLPMELLSLGTLNNKINLLSGEFQPKKEVNKDLQKWKLPAVLAVSLFMLMMVNLYLQGLQADKQTLIVKQQVERVYQLAFPLQNKLKYARIKKSVKRMLVGIGGDKQSGFLVMLNELIPTFAKNPELKPTNVKFDSKKKEMRLLATGKNFQSFEKFNSSLGKQFTVKQGALNSSHNSVSGLLTIGRK